MSKTYSVESENPKDKENISKATKEKRSTGGTMATKINSFLLIGNNGILSSNHSKKVTVSLALYTL